MLVPVLSFLLGSVISGLAFISYTNRSSLKIFPTLFMIGMLRAEKDNDKMKVKLMIIAINSYFATYI